MTGLKHCPFCGGKPQRITITDESEAANIGGDVITCADCDASTRVFFGEKVGIEEAWNTRLPSQPAPADREALVAVILDAMLGRYPGRDMARAIADALLARGLRLPTVTQPETLTWGVIKRDGEVIAVGFKDEAHAVRFMTLGERVVRVYIRVVDDEADAGKGEVK